MSPSTAGLNHNWPEKYRWFATGGGDFSGYLGTTELFKHNDWTSNEFGECDTEVQLPGGIGLVGHCAIQINSVETAIIGGSDFNGTINNLARLNLNLFIVELFFCLFTSSTLPQGTHSIEKLLIWHFFLGPLRGLKCCCIKKIFMIPDFKGSL